ncbi:MAG: iron dependent repressor, metal binding and dimerization domain protein [Bacillota bacterium]
MLSPSLEDYLEEIYRFSLDNNVVRVSDIAACLNVTLPSVNNAIRKLSEKQYLIYKKYRQLVLTEKGRKVGRFLVDRNKILQNFLMTISAQCDVRAEAEAMEHYLTLPTIRAIENLMDFLEANPNCRQEFLEHCRYRKEKGLGLKDGYVE